MALGGTITELHKRMSANEVRVWQAYRAKYGPMNDVRRHDRPAALISSVLSRIHGGKATQTDFMPFGKEEKEPSVNDLLVAFGGGVKIGKRR